MPRPSLKHATRRLLPACASALTLACCSLLSGCLVAGYGTNNGDTFFLGGFSLVFLLALILWFLLRKR